MNLIPDTDQRPPLLPFPFMPSISDAISVSEKQRDTFFLRAFIFQNWIGALLQEAIAQLAEHPSPHQRSFQTGQAARGFRKHFSQVPDPEFPHLFMSLIRFGSYDHFFCQCLFEAIAPLSIEHDLTGEYFGKHNFALLREHPAQSVPLLRQTLNRLCDWLDSVLQFHVFSHWHYAPDHFDAHSLRRQLTGLGKNQRDFETLNTPSRLAWLDHASAAALEHQLSPHWDAFHQAATSADPPPRPWPNFELDRAIIKLWPLLLRHHWACADLRALITHVAADKFAPCQSDATFAAYCADTLSLRAMRRRPCPKPVASLPGFNVALRLLLPPPPHQPSVAD